VQKLRGRPIDLSPDFYILIDSMETASHEARLEWFNATYKLLNNSLHKPSGPLANISRATIGFIGA
jgi:hypothetical protein